MGSPQAHRKLTWHSCNNGNCVEVAKQGDRVLVRDSKDLHGAVLAFTEREWTGFRDAIKAGRFDTL